MDVNEMLASTTIGVGDDVDVSGWLVDTNEGLYVLGDHFPEDYGYPLRIRISNGNVIYPILEKVPRLGGGWSALFHKVKLKGIVQSTSPWLITAGEVALESDRGSGHYVAIDIGPNVVAAHVNDKGDYQFSRARDPMRDWLDD